jgi:hypothetical protein
MRGALTSTAVATTRQRTLPRALPPGDRFKAGPLGVDGSRVKPRQRLPLYKLAVAFVVAAGGVGLGDSFVTSANTVYNSAVLGVGCGLIVVTITILTSRR